MKYTKFDELKMVKFLRFRNYDPIHSNYTYMTIKTIAKFLDKSEAYVQNLC